MMKDLLENYVLVTYDCLGYELYRLFYPNMDVHIIPYNTPLIAHNFINSESYIDFCEHYDYYTTLIPQIDDRGYFFPESNCHIWMGHDNINNKLLLTRKWEGRTKLGQNKKKIFYWDNAIFRERYEGYDWIAPTQNQFERFNNLNGDTIFLTDKIEDEYDDEHHIVKSFPSWIESGATIEAVFSPFTTDSRLNTPLETGIKMRSTALFIKQIIETKFLRT